MKIEVFFRKRTKKCQIFNEEKIKHLHLRATIALVTSYLTFAQILFKYTTWITYDIILLLTNHAGKNEIIAPKELIIAQVAKPRGQ